MNYNYKNFNESLEEWRDIKGYEGLYQVSNYGRVRSLDRVVTDRLGRIRFVEGKLLNPDIDKDGYLQVHLSMNGKMKCFRVHRLVAEAFIPNPDNLPLINHKNPQEKDNNHVSNLEWCTYQYNATYDDAHLKRAEKRKGWIMPEWQRQLLSRIHKGKPLSEETKRKLSEANKGKIISEETRQKISEANKGRVFSEEHNRKLSEAKKGVPNLKLRGRKHPQTVEFNKLTKSKPVGQFDKDMNLIATFPSAREAARQTSFCQGNISACCRGVYKQHNGYIWRYL